ncbi:MAG: hypothetical protein EBY17_04965 [Acidobacteriia bacterium]|nr:hypothetical protein [Terriglobia bacterium]
MYHMPGNVLEWTSDDYNSTTKGLSGGLAPLLGPYEVASSLVTRSDSASTSTARKTAV